MTTAEVLRAKARDYETAAIAKSDAGLSDEAKVAALIAVVLFEVAESTDEADES